MIRGVIFALLLLAIGTIALAQPTPEGTTQFLFLNEAVASQAAVGLVGRGVDLGGPTTAPSFAVTGGEILWQPLQSFVDRRGGRHVRYVQTVGGVELYGSGIGAHFTPAGLLQSVSGRQFDAVVVANRVAVEREQVHARAAEQLRHYGSFHAEDPASVVPSQIAARIAATTLKLVQSANAFRYVWFTLAQDAMGTVYHVAIDAENGKIVALTLANPDSNCNPTQPWQSIAASGYPVRDDLRSSGVRRSMLANVANNRPVPFTHEGFLYGVPAVSVLEETTDVSFRCDPNATVAYTLFPLYADLGVPTYRDRVGYTFHGYEAGDAAFNTREAMAGLATLGRAGWNGSYGDANIVVRSTYMDPYTDNAFFLNFNGGDPRLPPTRSVIITRPTSLYALSAALDVVAHEWGHGVIFTSADFTNSALSEGFADVIGQTVEKLRQPTGTGAEQSSDWSVGEDVGANVGSSGYMRSGETDDVDGHTLTGPNGSHSWNDAFHLDDDILNTEAHNRGNMMNVVFRLLTVGGSNPVCTRLQNLSGCTTSVSAQGFSKASTILFSTVQFYALANSRWEDLATYASQAAFDNYSNCDAFPKYHATAEQAAVNAAFTAIGYPRTTAAVRCQ